VAMSWLLIVHLGVVLALFASLPYGKFMHGNYRFAALLRNAFEQSRKRSTHLERMGNQAGRGIKSGFGSR
jgi:citrate/tricarballylate utilization protein